MPFQIRVPLWPALRLREGVPLEEEPQVQGARPKRKVALSQDPPQVVEAIEIVSLATEDIVAGAAPAPASAPAPAKRQRVRRPPPAVPQRQVVLLDGATATEPLALEGRATLARGSEVGLVVGGTIHYRHPTLRVPASAEHGEYWVQLALPIRATHALLGQGYLGLVAHLPSQRKSKPVFLSTSATVDGGQV